ncbi:hypothetical protein L6452_01192 [Arctium lappa]|uniref:Uncharacterized protein n=1 Tax=Arctium lappa TaxID=4217 RepID=A0ACB9FGV9_ARCLA|nr:hypothetical protein L6452_01192 [Arctium lappa]
MGGETRIVVTDRHTSFADISVHDSPVVSSMAASSVSNLDNMVDEYDRLNSSNPSSKPLQLCLFLFLLKPETTTSMGWLLDDAKSETWFFDSLNGVGLLPRGLSDSAVIDNLLEPKDGEIQEDQREKYTESKMVKSLAHDVLHSSLPYSPKVESTSSYGSSSSSPSMESFPPINVRVDHMNQIAGLDKQLSQLNVNHVSPPSLPLNNVSDWAVFDDDRSEQ